MKKWRSRVASGLLAAGLSLMLALPVSAHTSIANSGNGGMGTGMGNIGNGTLKSTNVDRSMTGTSTDMRVNVYGSDTGSQFLNTGADMGTNRVRTNAPANRRVNTPPVTDGNFRTMATTTNRGFNWAWLGLFGLLGLIGLWSRNPQRDRK